MHNLFIYHPVVPEVEQRTELESSRASKSSSNCIPLYVSDHG